jgi:hypothetical protein
LLIFIIQISYNKYILPLFRMKLLWSSILIITLLCNIILIYGHMEMKYPAPRLSQYAGIWDYTQIDYDMNAPLNMKGNKLCQGKPAMQTTATLNAGQTITVQIVGSAPHKGGHCQFALSYDNGVTWVVIADHLRTCPLNGNYQVTIPSTAPASNNAVLAWTWINAEGNREYYMNCADIVIKQANSQYVTAGFVTGKKLLIANQPGYPTVPEFLGNPETGMDLINARPTITVKLSGTSTGGTTTPPTTTPPTTTPPTTTPPTTTPPTTTPPTTTPPSTTPSTGTCKCLWAAYCGADSCGKTGATSACQCSSGSVCLGSPTFQCRKPGAAGAPVPTTNPPVDVTPPVILPTPGANCRCLWASYCGSDTCGIQGAGSACQCTGVTTCRGAPSFQCR